jgi:quinol monooxygenase YgiN
MKKRVIARIFIKNESIEAFKKQADVIIQKTRSEKGCLFYSLFEDVSRSGEFLFYEEYADQAALDIHFKSEYLLVCRL